MAKPWQPLNVLVAVEEALASLHAAVSGAPYSLPLSGADHLHLCKFHVEPLTPHVHW
jgi:hypothetical protein